MKAQTQLRVNQHRIEIGAGTVIASFIILAYLGIVVKIDKDRSCDGSGVRVFMESQAAQRDAPLLNSTQKRLSEDVLLPPEYQ
jgi:hypothetical protein